jgi:hypothetical protein
VRPAVTHLGLRHFKTYGSASRRRAVLRAAAASSPAVEGLEARTLMSATPTWTVTPEHVPELKPDQVAPQNTAAPTGITPAQMRTAYGINSIAGDGTGQTIAIVDCYDDPNIVSDLASFDAYFNIAAPPSFSVVSQTGSMTSLPAANSGWITEESLDVEWSHAIAPGANIMLVEANSDNDSDAFAAVNWARQQPGVSVVSMSWAAGDSQAEEQSYDTTFFTPAGHTGVTFVASSDDDGSYLSGGPAYPAANPNVLSVGGTTLNIDSNGDYESESAWGGSGGGFSAAEAQPAYQKGIVTQGSTLRGVPDVSFDADPNTGVPVFDSYNNGTTDPWGEWGGTSLSAPCWAGLIAITDQIRVEDGLSTLDGPSQTLPDIYSLNSANFHDITTGSNAYSAGPGYDLVTGLGTPIANNLVLDLTDQPTQLIFIQSPDNGVAGQNIAPAVTVAVQDVNGDTVSTDSSTVTLTLSNGVFASTGNNTASVAAVDGVATFGNLVIDAAGSYTITASEAMLNRATCTAFNITAAAAAKLVFTQQPSATTIATAITPAVTVAVEDSYGNIVTGDTSAVTLTLSSGTFSSTGSNTVSVSAVGGVASFSGMMIGTTGSYTVAAGDGMLSGATSTSFVVYGTPAQLAIIQQPTDTALGQSFSPTVSVAVEDNSGALVGSDGSLVTLTLSSGDFSTGSNAVTVAAVNGLATFNNLTVESVGSYTLSATDGMLAGAGSAGFKIATVPTVLSVNRSTPAGIGAETASVSYAVTFNEPVEGVSAANFQLVLGGGVSASSTLVVSPSSGFNSFYTVTINNISGTGTLGLNVANATGISDTSGNQFASGFAGFTGQVYSIDQPTQLAFTQPPTASYTGQPIDAGTGIQVAVEDGSGNTLSFDSSPVTLTLSSGTFSTGSNTATVAAVNGIATFSGLEINSAGNFTISARDGALVGATSGSFALTAVPLPSWVSSGSVATWNPSTNTLTVTGTANVISDPGSAEPIIQASGASAVVNLDPSSGTDIHIGGLSLTNGASAIVTSLGSARSVTNYHLLVVGVRGATVAPTYAIDSTSTLDLTDNDMAILYGSGTTPLATVNAQLLEAYDGGLWDKPGLTSSIARTEGGQTALGFGEAWSLALSSFDGLTLGGNAVLVKYTVVGDATLAGTVGLADYNTVLGNYNQSGQTWTSGSFDYSGSVGLAQYNAVLAHYNQTLAGLLPSAASPSSSTSSTVSGTPASAQTTTTVAPKKRPVKHLIKHRHKKS